MTSGKRRSGAAVDWQSAVVRRGRWRAGPEDDKEAAGDTDSESKSARRGTWRVMAGVARVEVVLQHFHRTRYRSSPLWFFCGEDF
jgi:hypothetical protein